jgi:NAD-dependent dihydropyrimidine dehydrogenase PreA subunit
MAYVIAAPRVGVKDTACVDVCPVDCIHPRRDEARFAEAPQLYIDTHNCICCGACVPACPVTAIFLAEDLPLQWKEYVQTNAERYALNNAPSQPE